MPERQKCWLLTSAVVLALGSLLGTASIRPSEVFSAPLVQDHTLNLDYGDDVTLDRCAPASLAAGKPSPSRSICPPGPN